MNLLRYGDQPEVRTLMFDLPLHRHRVMFHDGGIIDVVTRCTDSRVRDFAFTAYYGKKPGVGKDGADWCIVGMADLGELPEAT